MAFSPSVFSACAPVYSTDLKKCGTLTICDAKPLTPEDMTDVFLESSNYRVMNALMAHDIEVKMCTKVENGLYDLFMSNKVNMEDSIQVDKTSSPGLLKVRPFILGRRQNPINNNYWSVYNGVALSGGNYQYDLTSPTDMPLDADWFNPSEREFIEGMSGTLVTKTVWTVVSSVVTTATVNTVPSTSVIRVVLSPMNSGSYLPAAWRVPPVGSVGGAALGRLTRGTANISNFESWCNEPPGVIPFTETPFWIETTRSSLCDSEAYEEYKDLLMEQNPLFAKWATLSEVTANAQKGLDFKKRFVNQVFNGSPLNSLQRIATYTSLPTIDTAVSSSLDLGPARCVGFRANAVGYVEQLAECERLCNADGEQLNLWSLWEELYNIIRIREGSGQGREVPSVDVFTDNRTAAKIHLAMMNYYKTESANQFQMNMPVNDQQNLKNAHFGFKYRQYWINQPTPLYFNVMTHRYFDDNYADALARGQGNMGRNLWVIDFGDFDIGILKSKQLVHTTGDLQKVAAIDDTMRCTMDTYTTTTTLMSFDWTLMVQCPRGHLMIYNFSDAVPSVVENTDVVYPCQS